MKINLANEIAPYFHEDFFNFYDTEIKDGGRGSTKTTYFILKMLLSPFGIMPNHNVAYVAMRKHSNKIRRSVFAEFQKNIKRLGLPSDYFRISLTPFIITYKPTNSSIYFTGIDSIDDIKGFTSPSQKIIGCFFEEMTEIGKTLEEVEDIINSIIATFARGTDQFTFMGAFNPPKQKIAPINQWIEKYKDKIHHMRSNLYMLPDTYIARWSLATMVKQANNLKEIDNQLWRHVYLAEEIAPQNATYPNYESGRILCDLPAMQYSKINIGVDTGSSVGANVFIASGIVGQYEQVHVLKEFYHQNKSMGFLNSGDRVERFFTFAREIWDTYRIVSHAFIESADVQFYNDLKLYQQTHRIGTVRIDLVNKKMRLGKSSSPIEERIELEIKLIGSNRLKLSTQCKNLDRAFQLSERDNQGNRIDDEAHPVDSLDAFEYSLLDDLENLTKNIMIKGVLK